MDEDILLTEEQDELYEHYRIVVDKGQTLLRIDKFLMNRIENVSRSRLQAAADAGNILVNGKAVKPSYKVKPYDEISIVLSFPPREIKIIPENIPLEIVYEDDDVIVVNKQAGLVVHPGYGNYTGTLVNALAWHFKGKSNFSEDDFRPGLVHRLDKDTTGLMVVAKNELAQTGLAKQFFNRTIDRHYTALVWGDFENDSGTITGNIGRSPKDRKVMTVFSDTDQGKHAVTHYEVIERFRYVTLIRCKLETGRTHQIRVHMKHIGHPLFGDKEYGGDKILKGTTFARYQQFVANCFEILPRQALHATTLGFVHPITQKKLFFSSELPADLKNVVERWRRYTGEQTQ